MQYQEYAPRPELAAAVECLWTLDGHARELAGALQPVLPDGRSELVVHLGDPFDRIDGDGVAVRQPTLIFAGQLTRRLVLRPSGRIAVLGVRMHPHGARAFVRASQHELSGLTLDVAAVAPALGRATALVRDTARSLDEARRLMQSALIALVRPDAADRRVVTAVAAIARSSGRLTIDELAAAVDTTRRHLERLFLREVGMPPKRLARITRFQRALATLEGTNLPDRGAAAAHASGYADQAHFIRDFRALAGCAPGAHLLTRAELTGFFSGAAGRDGVSRRS